MRLTSVQLATGSSQEAGVKRYMPRLREASPRDPYPELRHDDWQIYREVPEDYVSEVSDKGEDKGEEPEPSSSMGLTQRVFVTTAMLWGVRDAGRLAEGIHVAERQGIYEALLAEYERALRYNVDAYVYTGFNWRVSSPLPIYDGDIQGTEPLIE